MCGKFAIPECVCARRNYSIFITFFFLFWNYGVILKNPGNAAMARWWENNNNFQELLLWPLCLLHKKTDIIKINAILVNPIFFLCIQTQTHTHPFPHLHNTSVLILWSLDFSVTRISHQWRMQFRLISIAQFNRFYLSRIPFWAKLQFMTISVAPSQHDFPVLFS